MSMSVLHATALFELQLWPIKKQALLEVLIGSIVTVPLSVMGLSLGESSITVNVCPSDGSENKSKSVSIFMFFSLVARNVLAGHRYSLSGGGKMTSPEGI